MKTNVLSYKFIDELGGSFQLFVDDILLAVQVNYEEDSLIPHWLIDKGIPTFPPKEEVSKQISERIVAVCGCGEYGCDCITCQVIVEDKFVIFSDFKRPGYSRIVDKNFRFTKENFQNIEKQITIEAEQIKESIEN